MPIHNRNHSNREPRRSLKGVYRVYTYRTCPACGFEIMSPEGQTWRCAVCELLKSKQPADLGAHVVISGGEVLELDTHLEADYELRTEEDMPF